MSIQTAPAPRKVEVFPPPRPRRSPWRAVQVIATDYRELVRFWPVVQNMVVQELRVRYQRSVLGFFWTLLNPILMMTTLALVFSTVFAIPTSGYAIYLFAGMVPWTFFQSSLGDCAFSIIGNEGLIRKIYLPKLIFPLTRVLINLTTLVLSMGALFFILTPLGAHFSRPMLLLPVALLLFAAFTLGLGLIQAVVNTFFRDCGHLVAVVLQAWYFATPIIYYPSLLGDKEWRFWLNPAYPFIRIFQDIIKYEQWPSAVTLGVAAALASVSLGVGYAAFKRFEDKLVFRL
jgi:ABC-type polysaccharide/polyol phosphate export permease